MAAPSLIAVLGVVAVDAVASLAAQQGHRAVYARTAADLAGALEQAV